MGDREADRKELGEAMNSKKAAKRPKLGSRKQSQRPKEIRIQAGNESTDALLMQIAARSIKTGIMPNAIVRMAIRRGLDEMERDEAIISEARHAKI